MFSKQVFGRKWWIALVVLVMAGTVQSVWAGASEHYPLGVEGIKAATLPPPGHYFRNYLLYYTADQNNDFNGNDDGSGFNLDVFAWAPRWIWITDVEILGGNYGMDILVPLFHNEIDIAGPGIGDDDTCIGDIYVEPFVLGWHGERWDAAVGAAFWAPTGDYYTGGTDPDAAAPGKGYWSAMFTFGGTVYLDEEKTWSVSILNRYEIHTEQDTTNITNGDDLTMEWGVGKTVMPGWDVGVAGYCHWQVTEDNGPGTTDDMDRVYGIGPEVSGMIKNMPLIDRPMMLSVRAAWEFGAVGRPEGFRTVITLTFPF